MSIPVNKTLEEVRTELFDRITSAQQAGYLPTFLNLNRGPIRGMIELWAWGLYQLYLFLTAILKQAFPSSATGAWLDLHCRQVDITRKSATKAAGTVFFVRTATAGNVPIPRGRIIKTLPDGLGNVYRFVTTADVVLQAGQTEVAAAVVAEQYGAGANVTVGQISEIATTIPGVDRVENRAGWLSAEGVDEEDDDSLRERYVLRWMEINGCTKYAYEAWARSVPGVVAARIRDQHPRGQGTVDVVVLGSAGIPTQQLIDAVNEVVQRNRPINDDALVLAPGAVSVAITAQLEITHGDPAAIITEATKRLQALFAAQQSMEGITPLGIGDDATTDRLEWAMMGVDGVKRVNLTAPTADVTVNEDQLAVLSGITLTSTAVTP